MEEDGEVEEHGEVREYGSIVIFSAALAWTNTGPRTTFRKMRSEERSRLSTQHSPFSSHHFFHQVYLD